MIREIQIPNIGKKIGKTGLEMAVNNNDDVLLSFCFNKKPKYGKITMTGIEWNSFDDIFKDADEVCHEIHQMLVINLGNKILAPCHAYEIYKLHVNPYTGKKIE